MAGCQEEDLLAEEEVGCVKVHQRPRYRQEFLAESLEVEAILVEWQVGHHLLWSLPEVKRKMQHV